MYYKTRLGDATTPAAISAGQKLLKALGYYKDIVDGLAGPNYFNAQRQYTRDAVIIAVNGYGLSGLNIAAATNAKNIAELKSIQSSIRNARNKTLDGSAERFIENFLQFNDWADIPAKKTNTSASTAQPPSAPASSVVLPTAPAPAATMPTMIPTSGDGPDMLTILSFAAIGLGVYFLVND